MNTRIHELAEQAGMTQYVAKNNKYLERFAELIIRESAAFLNGAVEVYTQADQDACDRAATGLKNYFGVEE